jgi:dTDP-4-dehydrorhamnose reductase
MFKILVLGSSGNLGNQLYKGLKKINNIKLFHTGLRKRKFDFLCNKKLTKFILSINPNLIINCIAYTDIDYCESFKSLSKKINFEIIKEIFKLKVQKKLKFNFIHFSTDQFYNQKQMKSNKENSKIYLINNYCIHKRMAEIECLKNKALIFRTNFFGRSVKNKTFSDWIFYSFKKKKYNYLFNDVYFNPLRIKTITKILFKIIIKKKYSYSGIYNLGSKNRILKSDFALLFAKKTGVLNHNYEYIKVNKLLKVKRSTNMFMDVTKFEKKFKFKLPLIYNEIKNEAKNYLEL